MSNYIVKLTPDVVNLASEGGLDSSLLNGVSLQRTFNDIMVVDSEGNRKKVGRLKDGESFDDIVKYANPEFWNTVIDTIWLYPISDVNSALEDIRISDPSMVEVGNKIIFTDSDKLYDFFDATFVKTSTSAGGSGDGYSLGVGTKLQDLGNTIHLELSNGLRMVTWRLVRQITPQSEVAVGGNSPDDTIGYVVIYCDWDENGSQDPTNLNPANYGFEYGDPLRVVPVPDVDYLN
jgi:hypothetical protein